MEPERKIEKLLRIFAKQRREQAGTGVELRESARAQLHREISRRKPRKSGGKFLSSLFAGIWPRFAIECYIVIIGLVAWLLLPVLSGRRPATLASANREPVNAHLAEQPALSVAPPPAVAPALVAGSKVARDITQKPAPFDGGAAPEPVRAIGAAANPSAIVALNKTLPPAGASKNGAARTNLLAEMTAASAATPSRGILADQAGGAPADSFASAGGLTRDPAARTPFSTAPQIDTNATLGVLAMAATEPEAQKKLNANGTFSAASVGGIVFDNVKSETATADAPVSQHFYRMNISSTRSAKETGNPEPVLMSFRVEQNAGELRVVDADGSVYTGTVQVANKDIGSHAVFAGAFKNAPAAPPNGTLQQMPGAQNYFFRVAGTNRNLRKNVVFSGNLIPLTNVLAMGTNANGASGSGGGGAGGAGAMPAALSPSLLSNSRISGKAVIGNQKEIEVNAAPAR